MGLECISLANAIDQMEELNQRLNILEGRAMKQAIAGPLDGDEQTLPEVRARVCGKTILLKIQCEKRKGILVNLLVELDKLGLDCTSASVVPFWSSVLDITITAEMEIGFSVSIEGVVMAVGSSLRVDPPTGTESSVLLL